MKIDVEDLQHLCECFPELEKLRDVTDKHGVENDITVICDVVGQLAQRIEKLTPKQEPAESDEETVTV